jgi:folate-binding protein YgfZ
MTDIVATTAPGFEHTQFFSTVAEEYAAIRNGAAVLDRSARLRMLFVGAKAGEALTGLVTNDVLSLQSGSGQFAAALTAKGKIIADVRVFARDDDYLVDASPASGAGFAQMIRKFVNPRLAQYADVSPILRTVGVLGPRAAMSVATVTGVPVDALRALRALAPYGHLRCSFESASLDIACASDLGVDSFDCFVPVEHANTLWERLITTGGVPVGAAAAEIIRVESGRPRWGVDMDENTLAQEANFDELAGISYTKGCYTGQETVARVHFRGHVNRHLRGLASEVLLAPHAELFGDDGQPCGEVRSAADSPTFGPIAIAMVRREIADGARVTARWDGSEATATVVALPFR